jgi:hypothetical protein
MFGDVKWNGLTPLMMRILMVTLAARILMMNHEAEGDNKKNNNNHKGNSATKARWTNDRVSFLMSRAWFH